MQIWKKISPYLRSIYRRSAHFEKKIFFFTIFLKNVVSEYTWSAATGFIAKFVWHDQSLPGHHRIQSMVHRALPRVRSRVTVNFQDASSKRVFYDTMLSSEEGEGCRSNVGPCEVVVWSLRVCRKIHCGRHSCSGLSHACTLCEPLWLTLHGLLPFKGSR